jgi:hypothetical protein
VRGAAVGPTATGLPAANQRPDSTRHGKAGGRTRPGQRPCAAGDYRGPSAADTPPAKPSQVDCGQVDCGQVRPAIVGRSIARTPRRGSQTPPGNTSKISVDGSIADHYPVGIAALETAGATPPVNTRLTVAPWPRGPVAPWPRGHKRSLVVIQEHVVLHEAAESFSRRRVASHACAARPDRRK